jgi:hypothetical protein
MNTITKWELKKRLEQLEYTSGQRHRVIMKHLRAGNGVLILRRRKGQPGDVMFVMGETLNKIRIADVLEIMDKAQK